MSSKHAAQRGLDRVSYGRNPHYIYSDGEILFLDGYRVPEKLINAFLYKVLLVNFRGELQERLREGKKEWTYMVKLVSASNGVYFGTISDPAQDPELAKRIEWLNSQEDEVVRRLMGQTSPET